MDAYRFFLARLRVDSLLNKKTAKKAMSTLEKLSKGSVALGDAYDDTTKWIDG